MEINKIEAILQKKIGETIYNSFNLMEMLFKIKDTIQSVAKREVSLEEASEFIKYKHNSDLKFGGNCIDLSMLIYEELKNIGLESKIVVCKTNGAIEHKSDEKIEHGHFTNILSEKKDNGETYYYIVDLGMFIPNVICFKEKSTSELIKLANGKYAKVEYQPNDTEHPYKLIVGKLNETGEFCAKDYAEFNPDKDSRNLINGEIYRQYMKFAPSYRLVSYNEKGSKESAISIDLVNKLIRIFSKIDKKNYAIKFSEIESQKYEQTLMESICKELNVPMEFVMNVINNTINNYEELKDTILNDNMKEYVEYMQLKSEVIEQLTTKVLPEFQSNSVNFHGHNYEVGFSINNKEENDDQLALNIEDKEKFQEKLVEFIEVALSKEKMKWVRSRETYSREEVIEHLLKQIWFNATKKDFSNPIEFIELQTKFLQNNTFSEYDTPKELGMIPALGNNVLRVNRAEQSGSNETPYMLNFDIVDKDNPENIYDLPSIRYAIDEDSNTAYIYAIQKRKRRKSSKRYGV